ncbi:MULTISPECIES: type IV secretory system conjugative DNA transfer family protein [unclassified Amycolatopsis]|uniref:type IV secretory system conjugative DNA transfer family protein n=1 Tax=unclassified Amycolatopsis TaxID=2618356 RepID=UPI0028760178|nr:MULTISPECIES: type IV secretory system conjugative DNA transfer family protein [unclassified Amycolatopsis]MDS0140553.1 type IV secretory system conjugative DNA transfer family protein [Amycolatopsis sp. 505]MDS0149203.1 type IV secretory system conjugative DNA transfer family protein [Amycolatopsis sp. CM201R]
MSTPPPGPRGDLLTGWLCIGAVVALELMAGLLWVAQGVVTVFIGRSWSPPAFELGVGPVRDVVAANPATPRIPALIVFGILLLIAVVMVMQAVSLLRRQLGARRRLAEAAAVNRRAEIEGMTAGARAAETARLHPTLTALPGSRPDVRDVLGVVLPSGPEISSGWEDVEVAWMAPRSGKTTARAVPRVLSAPGAVVATANRPDLYNCTSRYRARLGRVWRFDPQQITLAPQEFWWNPLRLVRDDETARQLAAQFVQAIVPNGGDRFWADSAADLLSALFLAASVSGSSLREVWRWLNASTDDRPVQLLDDHGFGSVAESLKNMIFLHPETRDSVYQTARTGASCLRNPRVLQWVTPQPGRPEFSMLDFVRSSDTMYLMSKDTAGAAAPLLAGFLDQWFDLCQIESERHGGRLPVPVSAVLDEVGNICPWDRLAKVVSYSGGLGVSISAILQSWAQGVKVWGENGMEMLFGATTVTVFGAGLNDERLLRRISQAVGRADVIQHSTTHSSGGRSDTTSTDHREILPPDSVRALPKGTALVLTTGRRPVLVRLVPWYEASYRDVVQQSLDETRLELAERIRHAGP